MIMLDGDKLLKELERHTKRCSGLVTDGKLITCPKCGFSMYQGDAPTIETKGVTIEVS